MNTIQIVQDWDDDFLKELLRFGFSATTTIELVISLLEKTKTNVSATFIANLIYFVNATYKNIALQGTDPAEIAK